MVKNIFEFIFILMAVKNYTSNFADRPFGPDYCSSSDASLTAPSIRHYFQCICKIFQILDEFSKILSLLFLNILQIQTYKYKHFPITVKCKAILWNLKQVKKKKNVKRFLEIFLFCSHFYLWHICPWTFRYWQIPSVGF